jgi:DNA-binding CsgD family transcriptional regulator
VGALDEDVRAVLRGLLPEAVALAYEQLCADGGREPDLHSGKSLDGELVSRGLAHVRSNREEPLLWAAGPTEALVGTIAHAQQEATMCHRRVIDAYSLLAEFQRRSAAVAAVDAPSAMVRVVTDRDEISGLSYTMINHARDDYMAVCTLNYDVPLNESTFSPPPPSVIERGVRSRVLYGSDYLSHPVGAAGIRKCREAGEESRTLPRLPLKFGLADEDVALLALTPTGTSGALLVRSSVVLAALRQYFEMLWSQATPVADVDSGPGALGTKERAVLELMAHGLKDDAIARRLDMSVRTVRRCVSAVLEHLQVSTRFAAGAAAQRRGLLG